MYEPKSAPNGIRLFFDQKKGITLWQLTLKI